MKRILSICLSFTAITVFAQLPEINQLTPDGLKTGKWQQKHSSGKLKYEGTFENDTPVGEFKRYDVNGKLTSTLLYSNSGKGQRLTITIQTEFDWLQGSISINKKIHCGVFLIRKVLCFPKRITKM